MYPFQRGFVVRHYLVENAWQYLTAISALAQLMDAAVNVARCRRDYNLMMKLDLADDADVDIDGSSTLWNNLQITQAIYLAQRRQFDVALGSMSLSDMWTLRRQCYWDLYFSLVHVPRWDPVLDIFFADYRVARLVAELGDEP